MPHFNALKIHVGWLVVMGFNATLTAKVISWQSVTHAFPGFLTPVLTQLFFPKPPITFLTCFCRVARRIYAGKKSRLNRGSNSHHQVTSPTCSPMSHPGGAKIHVYSCGKQCKKRLIDRLYWDLTPL